MTAATTLTTVTQTIYQRVPQAETLTVSLAAMDTLLRLVDLVHDEHSQPGGRVFQRYSDGAYFFFPFVPIHPATRDCQEGYQVRLEHFAGPARYWRMHAASYGHAGTALICAPTEEAARELFAAIDCGPPDEVREQPVTIAGVLAHESQEWDDDDH